MTFFFTLFLVSLATIKKLRFQVEMFIDVSTIMFILAPLLLDETFFIENLAFRSRRGSLFCML